MYVTNFLLTSCFFPKNTSVTHTKGDKHLKTHFYKEFHSSLIPKKRSSQCFSDKFELTFYFLKDLVRMVSPVYSSKWQGKISLYKTGNKIHEGKKQYKILARSFRKLTQFLPKSIHFLPSSGSRLRGDTAFLWIFLLKIDLHLWKNTYSFTSALLTKNMQFKNIQVVSGVVMILFPDI